MIGDKYTIIARIPAENRILRWPFVATSNPVAVTVERADGTTFRTQKIEGFSWRETRPDPETGETTFYLRHTPEDSGFMAPRFSSIPGLDYDPETKTALSLEVLAERYADQLETRAEGFNEGAASALIVPGEKVAEGDAAVQLPS